MKLLTYIHNNTQHIGALSAEETGVLPLSAYGITAPDMQTFLETTTKEEIIEISIALQREQPSLSLEEIQLCAPLPHPKQDVICLGINYMAHAEESARYKKEVFGKERPHAIYFSKRVSAAVADGEAIDGHFDIVDSLDYEAELAVIIGQEAYRVSPEDAFSHVFGYTILNDVSARNLQTAHQQWYFGKGLDGFTPMGPWIVTQDALPGMPALSVRSYINGELRQDGNTSQLLFDIPHIISELSQGIRLLPGTIIATGTPAGVGMGFVPPRFLKTGDSVVCEIEGIGRLCNVVK